MADERAGDKMIASDLAKGIWNGIADLVQRSQSAREIYYVKVTKSDPLKLLVWADDFGDTAIPLVAHNSSFAYFDTTNTGTSIKREDKSNANPLFQTHLICPKVGDLIVVLDPWGAKRFPICIGTIQSRKGFWEET